MRNGLMLVEVVLALAVAMVVMVALVQLSTRSIKNSDFSKNQAEATSYANQGMEWIRAKRVGMGWYGTSGFSGKADASGTKYCLGSSMDWTVGQPCSITGTIYTRGATLTFVPGSPERVKADVTVIWEQGGKSYSAKQNGIFTQN